AAGRMRDGAAAARARRGRGAMGGRGAATKRGGTLGPPADMTNFADELVRRMNEAARDLSSPVVRPKDAATLILVDRTSERPKVLLGRRHQNHKFMPGKFVFPGGRVEPADRRMAKGTHLAPQVE